MFCQGGDDIGSCSAYRWLCKGPISNTIIGVNMQGALRLTAHWVALLASVVTLWSQPVCEREFRFGPSIIHHWEGIDMSVLLFSRGWTRLGDTHARGLPWLGNTCAASPCRRPEEIKSCSILGKTLGSVKQLLLLTSLGIYFRQVSPLLNETMETQLSSPGHSSTRWHYLTQHQD